MVMAAERAVQAAELADNPLRLAGAMWNLAQAMGNQGPSRQRRPAEPPGPRTLQAKPLIERLRGDVFTYVDGR